jgi:hypothetical protein
MSMDVAVRFEGEEIVLYFSIDAQGVEAQTFGNALISFDGLYRAINGVLNPGLEIEIEFIRSDQGSIRAILRSFKKDTKTLLEHPFLYIVYPFLIAIVANYVTSLTSPDVKVNVSINTTDDNYIVQAGRQQIVLPRDAAEKAQKAERDPSVRRSVRNFFAVVESDPNINGVDFRSPSAPDQPVIPIERDKFHALRDLPEIVEPELPKYRQETHLRQHVVVVTAVLEASTTRKWQFLWNGLKIRAAIHDADFFEKLALHEYEFGQGDSLVIDLVAEQELNEFVRAYETKGYHVIKVHSHTRGPKQLPML